jgi:hypothetical protein
MEGVEIHTVELYRKGRLACADGMSARAGLTSDRMPGVVPRCVPMEIKNNQHGERATTITA